MNVISRDAWIGLVGVGLGFVGSLIVMLVGNWLQAWREARRIADHRRYEWVKDRLDRIDLYISQLVATSYELWDQAGRVLDLTITWWQASRSERPQIAPLVEDCAKTLEDALNRAESVRTNPPEVVYGSARHEVIDGTRELIVSFNRLWGVCQKLLSERKEASRQASESSDLSSVKIWEEEWRGRVAKEFRTFKGKHMALAEAMYAALAVQSGYRHRRRLQRVRRAALSKQQWKYWFILAAAILALVGWAITRGIIPWSLVRGIRWIW